MRTRQIGFEEVLKDASLTADATSVLRVPVGAIGFRLFTHVSDNGGSTPTLDVKVQVRSPEGTWIDLPDAALAQITTTASDVILTVYPGIAETADESVSDVVSAGDLRVVFTTGGTPDYDVESYIAWLS